MTFVELVDLDCGNILDCIDCLLPVSATYCCLPGRSPEPCDFGLLRNPLWRINELDIMLRLKITDETGRVAEIPFLRKEIRIGRKLGNTIRLNERNISRFHAVLSRTEEGVFVEDMDSYNGTILNGNHIARKTGLYHGDLIEIGDFKIVFEETGEQRRPRVEIDPEIMRQVQQYPEEYLQDIDLAALSEEETRIEPEQPEDALYDSSSEETEPEAPKPVETPTVETSKPLLNDKDRDIEQPPVREAMPPVTKTRIISVGPPQPLPEAPVSKPEPQQSKPQQPEPPQPKPEPKPVVESEPDNAKTLIIPAVEAQEDVAVKAPQAKTEKTEEKTTESEAPVSISESLNNVEIVIEPEPEEPAVDPSIELQKELEGKRREADQLDDWPETEQAQPKSKAALVVIVVLLLVASVGGYFVFGNNQDANIPIEPEEPPLVIPEQGIPIKEKEVVQKGEQLRQKRAQQAIEQSMREKKEQLSENVLRAKAEEERLRSQLIEEALKEAREQLNQKQWQDAEKTLNTLLQDIPNVEQARELREKARREKQNKADYQNGIKALAKNNYFQGLPLLGGIDTDSVYYSDARAKYEIATNKLVKEYTAKGWRAYRKEDFAQAEDYADKALGLNEEEKDAKRLKRAAGIKLKAQKENESQQAHKKDGFTARQHYSSGTDYYKKKQYDKAISHFQDTLRLDPTFAYAYRGLGTCYALQKQMDKAMQSYQRYIDLKPDAPDAAQVRKLIEDYKKNKGQ